MGVGFGFEPGVPPEVTIKRMLGTAPKAEPVVEVKAAPEAAVEPVEAVAEVEVVEPAKPVKRRRARHPKGHPEGGHFIGDDPATPEVNEAWE